MEFLDEEKFGNVGYAENVFKILDHLKQVEDPFQKSSFPTEQHSYSARALRCLGLPKIIRATYGLSSRCLKSMIEEKKSLSTIFAFTPFT